VLLQIGRCLARIPSEFHWDNSSRFLFAGLTLELSGRCRVPHDGTADRRSGPLERIVRPAATTCKAHWGRNGGQRPRLGSI
jgi:hypothetical protein